MKVRYSNSDNEERTVASEETIVLKNIQNTAHLTENKNARTNGLHTSKQLVQDHHLPRVVNQVFVGCIRGARFL